MNMPDEQREDVLNVIKAFVAHSTICLSDILALSKVNVCMTEIVTDYAEKKEDYKTVEDMAKVAEKAKRLHSDTCIRLAEVFTGAIHVLSSLKDREGVEYIVNSVCEHMSKEKVKSGDWILSVIKNMTSEIYSKRSKENENRGGENG